MHKYREWNDHEARSPSSRRAWIEISSHVLRRNVDCVALLAEGVDRNGSAGRSLLDANDVALLAEGVDRNHDYFTSCLPSPLSPSSRRAWIEIPVT